MGASFDVDVGLADFVRIFYFVEGSFGVGLHWAIILLSRLYVNENEFIFGD